MHIEIRPDMEPERGLLRRADQYPFLRSGVPAISFIFGYDPGTDAEKRYREWYQVRYHRPQDDLTQPMDFRRCPQVQRLLLLGWWRRLAIADTAPVRGEGAAGVPAGAASSHTSHDNCFDRLKTAMPMDILTQWLRSYLPALPVTDQQLAEDLTLRGIAVEGVFAVDGGSRLEMDITTNRVDAMNHYGVAREVAAIYNVALKPLESSHELGVAHSSSASSPMSGVAGFPVRIEARDLCGRFTARVIHGLSVGPATGQLASYFAALGQKPISGPVDATNFGWMAMGQPTHVFDLDTLEGGIVARRAKAGEKLRLLDGSERTLITDDLVIADEKKALGLAGVMGGWDSRVTEATKNILVEAAWFDPATVRASSRRHGLHTDASHRFERGADFNAAPLGNHLVTRLVVEQAGGEVVGPLVDVIVPEIAAKTADRVPITLRVAQVKRHLGATLDGIDISETLVAQYLSALGCELTASGAGAYSVKLPSWRLDMEREIDLIEEVARVYGYNRFADTLPSFAGAVRELPHAAQERALRETLRGLGYSEAVSSTFVAEEEAQLFDAPGKGAVAMGNPLSAEAGMLRPALTPGMASMLAENLHRNVSAVRLFELGTVFTGSTAAVQEEMALRSAPPARLRRRRCSAEKDALFYAVKGAVVALLARFDGAPSFDADQLPAWIEPGRGARALLERRRDCGLWRAERGGGAAT
jgi:phenylalanyl-tRNA synthetase beta chain